jgi:hypothetical protein
MCHSMNGYEASGGKALHTLDINISGTLVVDLALRPVYPTPTAKKKPIILIE